VFIMTVLSAAFSAASKSVRDLKAAGDNAERLRGAVTLLRRDLLLDHFKAQKRLSDNLFWKNDPNNPNVDCPPDEGFFRLWQEDDSVNDKTWGMAPVEDNLSYTKTRSMLHFTSRQLGDSPSAFFTTSLPADNPPGTTPLLSYGSTNGGTDQRFMASGGTLLRSQWAEIAWWLTPSEDPVSGQQEYTNSDVEDANLQFTPQPLWTLRRRQRLAWLGSGAPSGNIDVLMSPTSDYAEISSRSATLPSPQGRMNRAGDLTVPPFRMSMNRQPTAAAAGLTYPNTLRDYAGWPSNYPQAAGVFPPAPTSTTPLPDVYPKNRPEDIVLTHVLSFEVRLLLTRGGDFVTLFDPPAQNYGVQNTAGNAPNNPNYRFALSSAGGVPQGPLVFDTWSRAKNIDGYDYTVQDNIGSGDMRERWEIPNTNATIPMFKRYDNGSLIRIRAIQIVVRIWDAKSAQSRQTTLVVPM